MLTKRTQSQPTGCDWVFFAFASKASKNYCYLYQLSINYYGDRDKMQYC
jgi:hypothetical protein